MTMSAAALGTAIFTDWTGDTNNGFSSPLGTTGTPTQTQMVQSQCNQFAAAIVAAIQADAISLAYHQTVAQTIPTGANTIINFDTQEYDNTGGVTTGASWKFTCPTGKDGLYLLTCDVGWVPANACNDLIVTTIKNGSEFRRFFRHQNPNNQADGSGAMVVKLAAGDTLSVAIFQDTGVNGTTENTAIATWISMAKMVGS